MMTTRRAAAGGRGSSAEMAVDIRRQAEALLLVLALGCGAGLLYDLLRPPRWRYRGRFARFFLDALFCLCLGFGFFLLAMAYDNGRAEPASLAVAAGGFLLYRAWFSPLLLPIFVKIFHLAELLTKKGREGAKKFLNFEKKFFQKCRACIIVRR